MKSLLALLLLFLLTLGRAHAETDRVIVGVLALDSHKPHKQYIASSYVKYLESAGARVVPIFVGQPKSYYDKLINQINGLLLPGGGASLLNGPYAEAASHLIQLTIRLNKNGTYFPLWSSCLSFEKLITTFVGNNSWENFCNVENISLNLEIEEPIKKNPSVVRIFQDKSVPNIIEIVEKHEVAPNYHRICLSVDDFYKKYHLDQHFTLVSRNTFNNVTFVSTIEHKEYPIYGSQWHPEKAQFEFVVNGAVGNIKHDRYSVLVGQYFANFLVNEARRNEHHFASKEEELNSLIYMFNKYRVFTGFHKTASFEEIFEFPLPFPNATVGNYCYYKMYKLLLGIGLVFSFVLNTSVKAENDRIIIGVLAQESNPSEQIQNRQVIVASYVKFVESAGARVVPIFIGQPRSYYERLVKRINGVLMPGGDTDLETTKYAEAASLLIKLITELNQNGTYFPLWGTCLSFEKIITEYVGNLSWITPCQVEDVSLNLEFDESLHNTSIRMFQDKIFPNILEIVQKRKVAVHYHTLCLSVSDFYKLGIDKEYVLVNHNTFGNLTFVSTIEHRRYPIYATAWHPEKNQYEYVLNTHVGHVNHDRYAVLVSQYLGNFFINEARKNDHHFASMKEELDALIFNYNQYRMYTSKDGYGYDEIFEFPYSVKINI